MTSVRANLLPAFCIQIIWVYYMHTRINAFQSPVCLTSHTSDFVLIRKNHYCGELMRNSNLRIIQVLQKLGKHVWPEIYSKQKQMYPKALIALSNRLWVSEKHELPCCAQTCKLYCCSDIRCWYKMSFQSLCGERLDNLLLNCIIQF